MNRNESLIWNQMENFDLSEYTIVIPSVAVGNVGQLTCDLLISTLNMKKIASIYSPALIPIVGYDPYDLKSNNLSTCCELYKYDAKKIVVLQFRAPIVHKFARRFLEDLVNKFKQSNIRDIIVLTSSFAHEKKHVLTSPFRYVMSDSSPHYEIVNQLKWSTHESDESGIKIYGGGFASLLYNICCENLVPCLILYKYCSEGDNIPDAHEMLKYLNGLLKLLSDKKDIISQLVQPVSWKLLFGKPPPVDIY